MLRRVFFISAILMVASIALPMTAVAEDVYYPCGMNTIPCLFDPTATATSYEWKRVPTVDCSEANMQWDWHIQAALCKWTSSDGYQPGLEDVDCTMAGQTCQTDRCLPDTTSYSGWTLYRTSDNTQVDSGGANPANIDFDLPSGGYKVTFSYTDGGTNGDNSSDCGAGGCTADIQFSYGYAPGPKPTVQIGTEKGNRRAVICQKDDWQDVSFSFWDYDVDRQYRDSPAAWKTDTSEWKSDLFNSIDFKADLRPKGWTIRKPGDTGDQFDAYKNTWQTAAQDGNNEYLIGVPPNTKPGDYRFTFRAKNKTPDSSQCFANSQFAVDEEGYCSVLVTVVPDCVEDRDWAGGSGCSNCTGGSGARIDANSGEVDPGIDLPGQSQKYMLWMNICRDPEFDPQYAIWNSGCDCMEFTCTSYDPTEPWQNSCGDGTLMWISDSTPSQAIVKTIDGTKYYYDVPSGAGSQGVFHPSKIVEASGRTTTYGTSGEAMVRISVNLDSYFGVIRTAVSVIANTVGAQATLDEYMVA